MIEKEGGGGGERAEPEMMIMRAGEGVRDLRIVQGHDRDMLRRVVDTRRVGVEVGVQP